MDDKHIIEMLGKETLDQAASYIDETYVFKGIDGSYTPWWNKYFVQTEKLRIGFDLTDWALPLRISAGPSNAWVQFLCFDIDVWWGSY